MFHMLLSKYFVDRYFFYAKNDTDDPHSLIWKATYPFLSHRKSEIKHNQWLTKSSSKSALAFGDAKKRPTLRYDGYDRVMTDI